MAVTVVLRDESKQPVVFANGTKFGVHADGHLYVQTPDQAVGDFAPGVWSRVHLDDEASGGGPTPYDPQVF